MSSAIYLENYLDGKKILKHGKHSKTYIIHDLQTGLESLPTELERNFKLMRKLDDRAQTAMKSIDSHAKDFMRKLGENGAMSEDERRERQEDIKALFGKAKEYSDDKVQLAIQTYERCLKDHLPKNRVDVMHCLAKALYDNGDARKAKMWLLKVRHLVPHDPFVIFNLGLAIKKETEQALALPRPQLDELMGLDGLLKVAFK